MREGLIILLNEITELLDGAKVEAQKFAEKGNATAGRRVRVAMQDLKKKAQEVRVAITEAKKG